MQQDISVRWTPIYQKVIEELPHIAAAAGMALCGMNAVIDVRLDMKDVTSVAQPNERRARAFLALLSDRAVKGIGGEIRVDWPGGPTWIKTNLPVRYDLGGTGPHAARTMSALGARALVALQNRSTQMLSLFPPDVLVAEKDRIVAAQYAVRHGAPGSETFIFEFAAGSEVAGCVLRRSSRIIVRFDDRGIDVDPAFDALTPRLARSAGAGLISGFNNEPLENLDAAIGRVFGLTRIWLSAGLPLVHLELAGYASQEALERVLQFVPGSVTSVGMSHSELQTLTNNRGELASVMIELGERLGVERVCVHADHWAATATKRNAERERIALVTGCLVAAARAEAGSPVLPSHISPEATFHGMTLPELQQGGPWAVVSCPSPHLAQPVTTLGLGDTFTAGCLLVLSRQQDRTAWRHPL